MTVSTRSRSLFHYTTAGGLLGIIRDQCLFATHAEYSNDSSECKLILPFLIKILAAEYQESVPKLIDAKLMSGALLTEHGRAAYEQEAHNSVRAMLRALNNTAPYFIASFCMHAEGSYEYSNGLLSQWRGYARGGFAIEFDELGIDELNKKETAKWRYQGMITDTVEYEKHEARVKPNEFEGMAGAFLRTIIGAGPRTLALVRAKSSGELDKILGKKRVEDFGHPFLATAPFLKHFGFKEEAEYRIVALCNRPTKSDPGDNREVKKVRFLARSDGNVAPYIALYEGLGKQLPIKAVIVGPHAQQENQRLAVELLLERYGINAELRISEVPFRG